MNRRQLLKLLAIAPITTKTYFTFGSGIWQPAPKSVILPVRYVGCIERTNKAILKWWLDQLDTWPEQYPG